MIPNFGPVEVLIVLVIGFALFGAKRLPELGSGMGRGINNFRRGIEGGVEDQSALDPASDGQPDERAG